MCIPWIEMAITMMVVLPSSLTPPYISTPFGINTFRLSGERPSRPLKNIGAFLVTDRQRDLHFQLGHQYVCDMGPCRGVCHNKMTGPLVCRPIQIFLRHLFLFRLFSLSHDDLQRSTQPPLDSVSTFFHSTLITSTHRV